MLTVLTLTLKCASPGCGVDLAFPYLWTVDGQPWCQPCFWRLMED